MTIVRAATLALLAACGSTPQDLVDAAPPDAPLPPDAQLPALGPSFVLDDIHIASTSEDPHPFSLLGTAINPQLETALADGTLRLGLEIRDLDDPRGVADDAVTVAMYSLQDLDGDPADDFDADNPEEFMPITGSIVSGEPTIHFTEASIAASLLDATGVGLIDLFGGLLPLPLYDPSIWGRLLSAGGETDPHLHALDDGRLRTALPASVLSIAPNLASGTCPGTSMLDVLVTGCGLGFGMQPDVDMDDDGLETIEDTDADGSIDTCTDGDGVTVITGPSCATDPAIADGYRLIFFIHGVRARILDPEAA